MFTKFCKRMKNYLLLGAMFMTGTSAMPVFADTSDSQVENVQEVKEESLDVADQQTEYIPDHVDKKKVGNGELRPVTAMEVASIMTTEPITVETLYADNDGDGIPDYLRCWAGQYNTTIVLYDTADKTAPYMVGYLANLSVEGAKVSEVVVGENNTLGKTLEGCIYDEKTGLIYIPKEYNTAKLEKQMAESVNEAIEVLQTDDTYKKTKTEEKPDVANVEEVTANDIAESPVANIRAQVTYYIPENPVTDTKLYIENDGVSAEITKEGIIQGDIYSLETNISLANQRALSERMIDEVEINGVLYTKEADVWDFDSKTGILNVRMAPATMDYIVVHLSSNFQKEFMSVVDGFIPKTEKASAVVLNKGRLHGTFKFSREIRHGDWFMPSGSVWVQSSGEASGYQPFNYGDLPIQNYTYTGNYGNKQQLLLRIANGNAVSEAGLRWEQNSSGGGHCVFVNRGASMGAGKFSLSGDGTVEVPDNYRLNLYCADIEVGPTGQTVTAPQAYIGSWTVGQSTVLTPKYGYGVNSSRKDIGLFAKVLSVSGNMAVIGVIAPSIGDVAYYADGSTTRTTQAAAGIFKITWEVDEKDPVIDTISNSGKETVSATTIPIVTKIDSATKKPIQGAKFDGYVQNLDGNTNWQKLGTYTTDAQGKVTFSYSKSKDWAVGPLKYVSNSDEPHLNRSKIPADAYANRTDADKALATKSNEAKENAKKDLQAQFSKMKFKLVEVSPAPGYAMTGTPTAEGAGNKTLENTSLAKYLKRTTKKVLEKDITFDVGKTDKLTSDSLNGGYFDIYVSNTDGNYDINSPNAGQDKYIKYASDVQAVDGHIRGSVRIKSLEQTFESDNVQYVDNWDALRAEDKNIFPNASHNEQEAITKAQNQANSRADSAQNEFERATHKVKIVEKASPLGYKIVAEKDFVINANGEGEYISNDGTGAITNSGGSTTLVAKVGNEGELVAGAQFELRRVSDNMLLDSWTSTDKPHETSGLVPNTEYKVIEIKAPEGYVTPANTVLVFRTSETAGVNKANFRDSKVVFRKVDATGEEVEGAHITVTDKDGNVVDEWVSTKEPHKIKNLVEGKQYTLREEVAPGGLNIANQIVFTPKHDDIRIEMVDTVVRAVKKDPSGKYVKGALLQVLDKNGNVLDEWLSGQKLIDIPRKALTETGAKYNNGRTVKEINISDSKFVAGEKVVEVLFTNGDAEYFETDKDGNETAHRVRSLVVSENYILHEEEAPQGYVTASDIEFEADPDNDAVIEMIDAVVTFSKVDAGGEEIEGAKLKVIDEDGNIIDEWVSTKEPHPVENLEQGKEYILHEEVAPGGYVYAHDIPFSLNPTKDLHYEMIDVIHGVRKVDEHGNLVKGAKLAVVDNDGNILDEWITGQTLVELTEEQTASLNDGKVVELDIDTDHYTITPLNKEEVTEEDQAKEEEEGIIDHITDLFQGEEKNNTFTLKKVDQEGNYSYYEINSKGEEVVHRISNLYADTDYTIQEVETPQGYVKSEDVSLKTGKAENLSTDVIDRKVKFTKVDVTGDEIEGALIEVIDTNTKEVVDKWISGKEPHYIENLEVGKKYTIKETLTPGGYVQATAIDFEMTADGIDKHYKMVDAVHRIVKIDPEKKPVKNAKLAVYTKDGKKIDEWTTGQHILDITEEQIAKANQGKRVILDSVVAYYTDEQLQGMLEDLDTALEKSVEERESIEQPEQPEETESAESTEATEPAENTEDIFTATDYISKAFEFYSMEAKDMEEHVQEVTAVLSELNDENKEEITTRLHEYAEKVFEEENENLRAKADDLTGTYLEKNDKSSGGYTLLFVEKTGTMRYVDIDQYGDEANHRVSGLVAGNEYYLKELKAPFGYIVAPETYFTADNFTDLKMTVIDQFVLEQDTAVETEITWIWALAGVIFLSGIGYVIYRKRI